MEKGTLEQILATDTSRKIMIEKIGSQVNALKVGIVSVGANYPDSLEEILKEKEEVLKLLNERQEWIFNFQGGGWNSILAYTQEEAINEAKAEYKVSKNYSIDEKSFRIATPKETNFLLASFY